MCMLDEINAKRYEIYAITRRHKAEKLWVFGPERFITLAIREPEDYTLWREKNMYVGESLHEVAERARASGKRLREQLGITA